MNTVNETASSQPFIERDFYDFLNGAGNHELKLLTGAVVLMHSGMVYTSTSLRRTLLERQGEPLAWKFQASTPAQYCEQSLEPIGAVVTTNVMGERGKMVTGYYANRSHQSEKLALIGSLLSWSLDYSDISVQHVLGTTASNTQVRAPEVRHQIYMSLLTGDEGKDVTTIYEALDGLGYKHRPSLNIQLVRMNELGLIEFDSDVGQNPSVHIKHTKFEALTKKLEDTLPETQAAYAAIGQIGQGINTTVNEIVAMALEINPTLDAAIVRRKLLNSVNVRGFPGLELLDSHGQQRSTVKLSPKASQPITDLCERLESVRDGAIVDNVRAAKDIISSKPDFKTLTAKARRFSHAVAGSNGREVLEQQLVSIVGSLGASTVSATRDALKERYGREMSSHMLRAILNKIASEGKLKQDLAYRNQHSKKSTRIFKPADEN